MELAKLLYNTGVECPPGCEGTEVKGIAYDSRKVEPGFAFVCISGFKTDGHNYAEAAKEKGASVIFTERNLELDGVVQIVCEDNRKTLSAISSNFFGDPTKDAGIFAVTGTNGKTTISYLMKEILEKHGRKCGLLGTIEYRFGDIRYDSSNTTPESYELQRLFREMKDAGADSFSMEVSSHALALSRVADVKFDCAVFTNLTPDHMDFHKDFEDYYQAKKKLFHLAKKACVINVDDEYGRRLFGELVEEGVNAKSFGVGRDDCDYCAFVKESSARGSLAEVRRNGEVLGDIRVNTPGEFSVSNALAAAAVSLEAGIPWDEVCEGISGIKGVPGRFQAVDTEYDVSVIVDYAHTPDALVNVLNTARGFTEGRLISVFGCGGDRDNTKRPIMGREGASLSDYTIVTSDNPRTEDPLRIVDMVVEGVKETGKAYEVEPDRRKAIRRAIEIYKPGDVVVIAGKGHEDYQIIGTVKHHFDDREEALAAINDVFGGR